MPDEVQETPAVESTPVATPEAALAPEVDPFDDDKVQQFDRAYVERLRKEAADRRTAVKRYEDVYSSYDAEEQEIWLNLAKTFSTDPKAAAQAMDAIARSILVDEIEPTAETPSGDPKVEFLTQQDIDRIFSEREQKESLDREVANINSELKALGVEQGTPAYQDVLWRAQNQHGGDIQAANAARVKEFEDAMDTYLQEKAKTAINSPTVVTTTGAPASDAQPIKTFADARAAVEARLAAQANNGQ